MPLNQAQASSRTALAELRTLLHLVRGHQPTAPAPGLAQLEDLAATARDAGIDTHLSCHAPSDLPAAVELTAYRVVQEAVTNTIRHSQATRTDITISTSDGHLHVDVCDDGPGSGTDTHTSRNSAGFGLVGMRERVEAHGGQIRHGPLPGGGFRVHAELPIQTHTP